VKAGWFHTPGRPGDRTLDDQLKGLQPLLVNCRGKTVLDVGSAEGLISHELARRGAVAVHGLEIVPDHVEVANTLRRELPCIFEVADANHYVPARKYDIVIMLAILHKLRDPTDAVRRFAYAARESVVLRLPPVHAPFVIDERSGFQRHDIAGALQDHGFWFVGSHTGHFDEWVGYYQRKP
jgi:trans-aconitate methyltransferase